MDGREKGVALVEDLIKRLRKEGDRVVDLTMGRGSRGVGGGNRGGKFMGIELEGEY